MDPGHFYEPPRPPLAARSHEFTRHRELRDRAQERARELEKALGLGHLDCAAAIAGRIILLVELLRRSPVDTEHKTMPCAEDHRHQPDDPTSLLRDML